MVVPKFEVEGGTIAYRQKEEAGGCQYLIELRDTAVCDREYVKIDISFSLPAVDICGIWYPNCRMDRSLKADWDRPCRSWVCLSAPVVCLYNEEGENRLTFALSEAIREVEFGAGVCEEEGTLDCFFYVEIAAKEMPYQLRLYLDWQEYGYGRALEQVAVWWEKECGIEPMKVPDAARLPMYSTWYSYHQDFNAEDLEKEARQAKRLGFDTLIVDDGWQTDDKDRAYAFCGDWQVCENKISDMKRHVANIHALQMKYMLWYSVPFVGKRSDAWKSFENRLLWFDEERQAGVLDIRYPQVREYLTNLYLQAVKEWDLDGLKLDFVDEFYIRKGREVPFTTEMDFERVEEALMCLLKKIRIELQRIKPDIMIEFRQWYVGPYMRSFGNIIRVTDCPLSALSNRVGIIDIRLLSGQSAVHSDMIMWHEKESAQDAARQIIGSIFANLQLSVKLSEQDSEKLEMIRFWVNFIREKKEILQKGELSASEPQNLYPLVTAIKEKQSITAVYSKDKIVRLPDQCNVHTVINGTKQKRLVMGSRKGGKCHVLLRNCLGEILEEKDQDWKDELMEFAVMPSGLIEVEW